jgi:hypothetical protein
LKPFTPDELLHRISENMNGHKHIADKTH